MPAPGPAARLAAAKILLRARIAARRQRCASLAARVASPLRWVDQIEAWWQSLGAVGKIGGAAAAWLAWRWSRRSDDGPGPARSRGWWREITRWLLARASGTIFP